MRIRRILLVIQIAIAVVWLVCAAVYVWMVDLVDRYYESHLPPTIEAEKADIPAGHRFTSIIYPADPSDNPEFTDIQAGPGNRIFIADSNSNHLIYITPDGSTGTVVLPGISPAALACVGNKVFIADRQGADIVGMEPGGTISSVWSPTALPGEIQILRLVPGKANQFFLLIASNQNAHLTVSQINITGEGSPRNIKHLPPTVTDMGRIDEPGSTSLFFADPGHPALFLPGFSNAGKLLGPRERVHPLPAEQRFRALTVSTDENLLAGLTSDDIWVFDRSGNLLTRASLGNGLPSADLKTVPVDLAMDSDGRIYIMYPSAIGIFHPLPVFHGFTSALAAMGEMDHDRAAHHWREILDEYPNSVMAHFGMGRYFDARNQWFEAVRHYHVAGYDYGYDKAVRQAAQILRRRYLWFPFMGLFWVLVVYTLIVGLWNKKQRGR